AVAAAAGALGAALAEMVARLTTGRKAYAEVEVAMDAIAVQAGVLRQKLLDAVPGDVAAFAAVLAAYRLPKDDPNRAGAIQVALRGAADVPLAVARAALAAMKLAGQVAAQGNRNAVTDAMAGIHLALAAVEVAGLNVRANVASMDADEVSARYLQEIEAIVEEAHTTSAALLAAASARAGFGA
ncbi:MAG: cyclodeaminase/cyclohydrolase family protein, partial [Anaerolineae bacterium]|nr:cyclodeaminase/cyclohydrolase family protein [Anaerolineae bacterium]